jgi:hypothetical protein
MRSVRSWGIWEKRVGPIRPRGGRGGSPKRDPVLVAAGDPVRPPDASPERTRRCAV